MKMPQRGQLVVITKTALAPNPQFPSGSLDTYLFGEPNLVTLPVEYEMVGILRDRVVIGKPVKLFRIMRNGVRVNGRFSSTPVVAVRKNCFTTLNSVYQVEALCEKEETKMCSRMVYYGV